MAEGRGGLLSAGGILSIIVGAFEIVMGGIMVAVTWVSLPFWPPPSFPGVEGVLSMVSASTWLLIIGGVFVVLGIIAVVGGASAVKRGSFGLSLLGAIFALPSGLAGVLAVIFVSLGRGEFEEAD